MNKYNRFMNNIHVTDEMRERVLHNIKNADLQPKKQPFYLKYRSFIAAAACLMLLIAGGLTLPKLMGDGLVPDPSGSTATSDSDSVQVGFDAAEYSSAAELSNALGFSITLPEELPFKYDSTEYLAMWSEMAEVNWYSGGEKTACFRQQKGSEDISGDYTVYSSESSIEVDGVSVTVKGSSGIKLAVWSSGGMSYSLSTSIEMNVQQLEDFVRAVMTH